MDAVNHSPVKRTDSKQSYLSPEVLGRNLKKLKLDAKRQKLNLAHETLHPHRASGVYRHGREICPQRHWSWGACIVEAYEFRPADLVWTSKPFKYLCLGTEVGGTKCTSGSFQKPVRVAGGIVGLGCSM